MKGKSVSSYILSFAAHNRKSLHIFKTLPYVSPPPFPSLSLPFQRRENNCKKKKSQLPRNNINNISRVRWPLCVTCKRLSVCLLVRACAPFVCLYSLQQLKNSLYRRLVRILHLYYLHLLWGELLVFNLGDTLDVVVIKDFRVPARCVRGYDDRIP